VTTSHRVLVLGSGFVGLWSALGAARRLDELNAAGAVDVTVISAQPFHDIRVRNYEADLSACRIPLSDVLDPVGVGHIAAEVMAIDIARGAVTVDGRGAPGTQRYDRLVMAPDSRVAKPDIPGLREFGFDVDTYDGAVNCSATWPHCPTAQRVQPRLPWWWSVPASRASKRHPSYPDGWQKCAQDTTSNRGCCSSTATPTSVPTWEHRRAR
jgi:NADH dehydrogenase FAD-containing subunit